MLFKMGADKDAKNNDGNTALDLCGTAFIEELLG
jgi:hypothetical protein